MTAVLDRPSAQGARPAVERRGLSRRPSIAGVVGGVFVLCGLAVGLRPLVDNSFLTQLATGHLILSHGIPRTDPYSFTAHGRPWTVESWLADAAMAMVSNLFGGHGIQAVHGLLTASLAGLAWRLSRPAVSLIPRVLAVLAALATGPTFWSERPLLVGLVLLALVVLMAETERFTWWLVIPMMWLWVNVHGSFALAGLYLVLRLLGRRLDGRPWGRLGVLFGWVAVGTLLGAVSPLGDRLLLFPLKALTHHQALGYIAEWKHPSLTSLTTWALLAQLLVALAGGLRRRRMEDLAVAVVFGALAWMAVRNVSSATLVLVPVTARALRGLGQLKGDPRPRAAVAAVVALVAVGSLLAGRALSAPAYRLDAYPVADLNWAKSHGLLAEHLAAPDFVGNLMEAEWGPGRNVFIDDRYDMYPLSLVRDYAALKAGGPGAERILDRRGIGAVLWPTDQPLARRLAGEPGWRVVLRDPKWELAVRAGRALSGPRLSG